MPPTNTLFASLREAQSPGPQCDGGLAVARGLTIFFAIVLLHGQDPDHRAFWLNIRCAVARDASWRRISSFHWRISAPCWSRLNEFQLG